MLLFKQNMPTRLTDSEQKIKKKHTKNTQKKKQKQNKLDCHTASVFSHALQ